MQFNVQGFFFRVLLSFMWIHTAHSITLEAIPWFLNADGQWITHVKAKHFKQDILWSASAGEVSSVPSWYTQDKEMVVHLAEIPKKAVKVTARSAKTHRELGKLLIPSPAAQSLGLQFTVKPIGPYLINMGWFNSQIKNIKYYRLYSKDHRLDREVLIAKLNSSHHFFHDDSVKPNQKYTYRIVGYTHSGKTIHAHQQVTSPAAMRNFPLSSMQGIGATLFFCSDPTSSEYFKHFPPELIFKQAKQLHVKYIQLRTVYGSYIHTETLAQKQWLDKVLDAAHDQGIAVFSWCIPQRDASSTLAADVAMAAYTSPKGNGFAGISLDLEIEHHYIDNRPRKTASQQIRDIVQCIRKAVGPNYLFSAIVYSPAHNFIPDFPFKSIGKYASIIQPMEFWHYHLEYHHHKYTQDEVSLAIAQAIKQTRQRVGRDIPINVIGQLTDLNDDEVLTGIPTAKEIKIALKAAKANGALGVSFYNWNHSLFANGVLSPQAQALKSFFW